MSGSNPRSSSSAAAQSPTLSYHAKKTVAFAQECAIAFAKECAESTKRPSSAPRNHRGKDSHIVYDYVAETKQYFVRASLELHAPLSEILDIFASADPDTDPFFSRLFERAIDVSTVAQHHDDLSNDGIGAWLPPSNQRSSATDDDGTTPPSTKGPVARTTLIKRIRFHDKKRWKKELLCLEHVEPLSPTSVVRFYESVDSWSDGRSSSMDSWAHESSANATQYHQNVTFGFLFEKISRANRLRLTFLGYHTTATRGDESCHWLDKVATSLTMIKNVVLRRRLTQDSVAVPSSKVPAPSPLTSVTANFTATLPRVCHTCSKSFHLFRRAHFCQVCQAAMCSKCTRHEDVESAPGLVASMQVCHACQVNLLHRKAMLPTASSEADRDPLDDALPRHRSRLHNHRRPSSRRALSQRDAPQIRFGHDEAKLHEDKIEFDARRHDQGVAMIPPFAKKPPASATPRRTPRQAMKETASREFCTRCCAAVSVGVCGACTMPFCGSCSVLQNVQVGPTNVFELQLCHGCVAETAKTEPPSQPPQFDNNAPPKTPQKYSSAASVVSAIEPIVLRERPSFNSDAEAMMRTMTLRPHGADYTPKSSTSHWKTPALPPRYAPSTVPLLEMEVADVEEHIDTDESDRPRDVIPDNQSHHSNSSSSHSHFSSRGSSNISNDDHPTSLEDQLQMFACLDLGANTLHDALCEEVCGEMECANAYVTLLYQGASVLKGAHGPTAPSQIPSTCVLVKAILASNNHDTLVLVPDATADTSFAASPRVTGAEGIRFFCGLPLCTSDGHVLGTVSVADTAPRLRMSPQHRKAMETFHDNVVALIEDRLAVALEGL